MRPVTVEGVRILLREFTPADSSALLRVYGDPKATEFLSFEPRTLVQVEALIEGITLDAWRRPRKEYALAVVERRGACGSDGDVVGMARLALGDFRSGQIGFALRPDRWRRGLGTETVELLCGYGFGQLGLHRIWGARSPLNEASERLMLGLGMVPEGRIRDHVFVRGGWRDSIVHSVLEDEWAGQAAARRARRLEGGLGVPSQSGEC